MMTLSRRVRARKQSIVALLFCFFGFFPVAALAQANEVSLMWGGYFPMHVNARSDRVFAVQGSIARRIFHVPVASVYIELPITGALNSHVSATKIVAGQSFDTESYSAIFITPGLRLALIPRSPISPYVVFGAGLAHFSRTQTSNSSSTNTGTLDVGGGLDCRLAGPLRLRGEVQDFYSGAPELIRGLTEREHHLLVIGGAIVRF